MDDRNVIDEFTKTYHKTEDSRVGQQTRLDQQTQLRQARLRRAQSRQAQYRARVAQASSDLASGQRQFGPAGPQPPRPDGQPQPGQPQGPQTPPKPHKCHKCAISIISLIIGIVLGSVGMYAVSYFFLTKPTTCPECDCQQQAGPTALNSLDYDFLKLESASDNIIYSPLSIKNGLALLNAGAAGTTKAEISNVLGDSEIPQYKNIPDTLSLANAVFVRDTFKEQVLPTYTSTVENNYGAEIIYDNFENSANMDNWVSQKTFGLINNIGLQPNSATEMVLTNALAIQMDWQHAFSTNSTSGRTFVLGSGKEVEATTMHQNTSADNISYYQGDDATAITMPLQSADNTELEFAAIMPSGDLNAYINNLSTDSINAILNNTTSANTAAGGVDIYVPKFKFDYSLNFKNDLENLGITQAFTKDADFSNMASADLHVSDAIHKANIDFSEAGIKAAAVTSFAMVGNALAEEGPQPIVIDINRPFLFLIRDRVNNTTWFTGAVYQPNLWANDATSYQQS